MPASTARQLALLALPTFGQLIAEPAFVLIDTAIVGHVSDSALAGLSLGSSVILTAVGLCVFLAYATTSHVAHLLGAGKRREGLQAGMDGLWLGCVLGFVLAAVLAAFAEPICYALGGRGETLSQAVCYVRTVALGVPGMLIVYAANGIFRGLQKVGITLAAAASGAALNTVLDLAFVIGLGWGIFGSGIATGIAQWFMGVFLLVPALRWMAAAKVSFRPRLSGIAAATGDAVPLFVRTLALRCALMANVMAAASMGTDVLAAYQVVNALWSFALNILDSIAIAGQTLVGARLGARDFERAYQLVRSTARFGALAGVAVGVLFALLGLVAGPLFSPSPSIQGIVAAGMLVVGGALPLQGWMWALDGILIGAGDFRYLALTCTLSALAHVAALAAVMALLVPLLPSGQIRMVVLWGVLSAALMGGRALANGLRVRGNAWMGARR